MNPEDLLFKEGVTTAIVGEYKKEDGQRDSSFFSRYKDTNPYILLAGRNKAVFFATEEARRHYVLEFCSSSDVNREPISVIDWDTMRLMELMGLPPQALDYYPYLIEDRIESRRQPSMPSRTRGGTVHYYGIDFTCFRGDILSALQWLETNKTIPSDIKENDSVYVIYSVLNKNGGYDTPRFYIDTNNLHPNIEPFSIFK